MEPNELHIPAEGFLRLWMGEDNFEHWLRLKKMVEKDVPEHFINWLLTTAEAVHYQELLLEQETLAADVDLENMKDQTDQGHLIATFSAGEEVIPQKEDSENEDDERPLSVKSSKHASAESENDPHDDVDSSGGDVDISDLDTEDIGQPQNLSNSSDQQTKAASVPDSQDMKIGLDQERNENHELDNSDLSPSEANISASDVLKIKSEVVDDDIDGLPVLEFMNNANFPDSKHSFQNDSIRVNNTMANIPSLDLPFEKNPHSNGGTKITDVRVNVVKSASGVRKQIMYKDSLESRTCKQCSKVFKASAALSRHMRVHSGLKPHVCVECGMAFSQRSNMKQHYLSLHLKQSRGSSRKSFQRRIFTKPVTTPSQVSTSQSKKFECNICCKLFQTSEELRAHMKIHSSQHPYVCEICNIAFTQRPNLNRHYTLAHGGSPDDSNRKDKSKTPPATSRPVAMTNSRSLLSPKTFACPTCKQRFSNLLHLNDHLKVHSIKRPFTCPECFASFTELHNMKRHRIRFHSKSPQDVGETV